MTHVATQKTDDWLVAYNPYTDILQIYQKLMLTTDKKTLKTMRPAPDIVIMGKDEGSTYLIEVKDAYTKLGNIDNKSKQDIIKEVREYVFNGQN